jgi:hypothetical protein
MKYLLRLLTLCYTLHMSSQNFELPLLKVMPFGIYQKIESDKQSVLCPNKSGFEQTMAPLRIVSFVREEPYLPNLLINYTFNPDSVLTHIQYIWDESNFEKKPTSLKTDAFLLAFVAKYNSLVQEISIHYGTSIQNGFLDDLDQTRRFFGLYRDDAWIGNEDWEIKSYIHLSNHYTISDTDTIFPIHKMEVQFTNINKSIKSLSPNEITPDYNYLFHEFITLVHLKDFQKAKNYLSEKIRTQINEDFFNWINHKIDAKKDLQLYNTRFQLMSDGTENTVLQFKYKKDTSINPSIFVSVLFENDGKILGINPVNLNE